MKVFGHIQLLVICVAAADASILAHFNSRPAFLGSEPSAVFHSTDFELLPAGDYSTGDGVTDPSGVNVTGRVGVTNYYLHSVDDCGAPGNTCLVSHTENGYDNVSFSVTFPYPVRTVGFDILAAYGFAVILENPADYITPRTFSTIPTDFFLGFRSNAPFTRMDIYPGGILKCANGQSSCSIQSQGSIQLWSPLKIDNLVYSASTPEPGTFGLGLFILVGILVVRRVQPNVDPPRKMRQPVG
ncbi:MAG TPA: hypothetical protein VEX68_07715 [Bryobacteraceae bacterium]|nr:hypothetical protein [Bryobacteraceae bacterium]